MTQEELYIKQMKALIKNARAEVEVLSKNMKFEYRQKLDYFFEQLNGDSQNYCIYGAMTEHCLSAEAQELYAKTISSADFNAELKYAADITEFNARQIENVDLVYTPLEVLLLYVNDNKNYIRSVAEYLIGQTTENPINEKDWYTQVLLSNKFRENIHWLRQQDKGNETIKRD